MFADIRIDDIVDRMRYAFRNQEESLAMGERASNYVRENLTYVHAARSLLNTVWLKPGATRVMNKIKSDVKLSPRGENEMKITVKKVTKRRTKRYIYFTVENDSLDTYKAPKGLVARFWKVRPDDGAELADPEWGRLELPSILEAGQKIRGRVVVDLADTGKFTGDFGVVTTGVKWHPTVELRVE